MDTNGSAQLSIGEVARRAGVRTSAIRYYEAAGLLTAPARQGGQRRYDASVFRRLAVLQVAQEAGFTIAEIRELLTGLDGESVELGTAWRRVAERKLPKVRALAERAREMERWLEQGLGCECLDLNQCQIVLRRAAPMEARVAAPTRRPSGWQRQRGKRPASTVAAPAESARK